MNGRLGGPVFAVVLLGAGLSPALAASPGVHVAIEPRERVVAPDTTFVVSIVVTREGASFNAFDLHVGYDPDALTLVPQTPAAEQEGAYFVAGCSNRFHRFHPGAGRDTITDVLLCAGKSLTGPGEIYRLTFRASRTSQVTAIRLLPGVQFYDAGLFVNPDSTEDARIGIGVPLADVAARPLNLTASRAAPRRIRFTIASHRSGTYELDVRSAAGRTVRRFSDIKLEPGETVLEWDGRDDRGHVVASGRYVAVARKGTHAAHVRFAWPP